MNAGAGSMVSALRALGVTPGRTVFVHADVSRLGGPVSRGSMGDALRGLHGALREAIGPAGTLASPSFTYAFCKGGEFDPDRSPAETGLFPNYLLRQPGVVRSQHPVFSCAAEGPAAAALCGVVSMSAFGPGSALHRLLAADALLLFAGAAFDRCTYLHVVEESVGVSYRYPKVFRGRIRTPDWGWVDTAADVFVRDLERHVETRFDHLESALRAAGEYRESAGPESPRLLAVECAALHRVAEAGIRSDERFAARWDEPATRTPPGGRET